MPNLSYNRGRALEYRVRDHYKKEGYEVFRSAGSHTMADLICIAASNYTGVGVPEVLLVQCKGSKNLMTKKQVGEFADYCENLAATAVIAYNEKRKLKLDVL